MPTKPNVDLSKLVAAAKKPNSFALTVATVVLLVGALATALWPVKTEITFSCGSFLVPNSRVFEQVQNTGMDVFAGPLMENGFSINDPLIVSSARGFALEQVKECESRRTRQGAIAGVLFALALGSGGVVGYRVYRSRTDQYPKSPAGSGS